MDNIKMLVRQDDVLWTGLNLLKIQAVEGSCEHGNEPSGSIKCREVHEWLQNSWLV
jgi:hypothetical protein